MTKRQIEKLTKELNKKYYGDNPHDKRFLKVEISNEDKILYKKISIMDMMLSNLAYGGDYFSMCEQDWYKRNLYGDYDWVELEKLGVPDGMQAVKDLWEEMKADFKAHATVYHGVYTDSEGCTYNSVVWDDDEREEVK